MAEAEKGVRQTKIRTGSTRRNQDGGRPASQSSQKDDKNANKLSVTCSGDWKKEDEEDDIMLSQKDLPDSIACKVCKGMFCDQDDKLLECDRCQDWECLNCSGMDEDQYRVMNEVNLGAQIHWYCKGCKLSALKAVRTDKDIEARCEQYMSNFRTEMRSELKDEVNIVKIQLEKKIHEEVDRMTKMIGNISTEASKPAEQRNEDEKIEQMEEMLEEMKEREIRKLNLVIFNLKESTATDSEDRKKDDQEIVRHLLSSIDTPVPFSKCVRLGKPDDTPRPVRITAASVKDQHAILKAAVRLREMDEFQNVFVNRDQTPREQKNWRKLQEERKKKMKESEEAGENKTWVIRRGKVIPGRPKPQT